MTEEVKRTTKQLRSIWVSEEEMKKDDDKKEDKKEEKKEDKKDEKDDKDSNSNSRGRKKKGKEPNKESKESRDEDSKKEKRKKTIRRKKNTAGGDIRTSKERKKGIPPRRRPQKRHTLTSQQQTVTPSAERPLPLLPPANRECADPFDTNDRGERVDTASVERFAADVIKMGVTGIRKQFDEVCGFLPPNTATKISEDNPFKNRFADIFCLDETRVQLKQETEDYIHASWVKRDDINRTYIATQLPLENTLGDFWSMVFSENVAAILVITCPSVSDALPYWPNKTNEYNTYGTTFVNNKKVETVEKLTIHTLEILPEGCSNANIVELLHFDRYPDESQRSGRAAMRALCAAARVNRGPVFPPQGPGPIVAQCTSGVGRASALILADWLCSAIARGKDIDVIGCFRQLRAQRLHAIENEHQWLVVYLIVLDYILIKRPGIPKLKEFVVEMSTSITAA